MKKGLRDEMTHREQNETCSTKGRSNHIALTNAFDGFSLSTT